MRVDDKVKIKYFILGVICGEWIMIIINEFIK